MEKLLVWHTPSSTLLLVENNKQTKTFAHFVAMAYIYTSLHYIPKNVQNAIVLDDMKQQSYYQQQT